MDSNLLDDAAWVPSACTLPSEQQPLRVAEFDAFFANDTMRVARPAPNQLRVELRPDPGTAGRAASLAAREVACCSFFRFELTIADGNVELTVSTDAAHAAVLAALGDRADRLINGKKT